MQEWCFCIILYYILFDGPGVYHAESYIIIASVASFLFPLP